jgi:sugar phosphate isomerase/epimerase
MMVMHITDSLNLPSPKQYGKYGMDSIYRLIKVAEDLGVIIAIENTGREDYIHFVLSEINSNFFGFCYDSSHNRIYSQNDLTLLERLADCLVATHFSDNDGNKDRHWLPGEGIIDWEELCNVFPKNKYNGYLTLEVYPTDEQLKNTPNFFLSQAYQRALWIRDHCSSPPK